MIGDWIEDHLEWLIGFFFVGLVVLLVWSVNKDTSAMVEECSAMMQMARSPHDSLEARIACNKMRSDWETRMAISAAAGVVAGSNAGRR